MKNAKLLSVLFVIVAMTAVSCNKEVDGPKDDPQDDPIDVTPAIEVAEITSDMDKSILLGIGHRKFISYTVLPENADDITCSISSSDDSVASVNEDGYMTGIAQGNCTISVTSNSNHDVKFEIEVNVDEYAEVRINDGAPVLYKTGELSSVLAEHMAKEAVTSIAWTQPSRVNSSDVKAMSGYDVETRILSTVEEVDFSLVSFVAGGDSYMFNSMDSKGKTTKDGWVPYGICYKASKLKKAILPENAIGVDDYSFSSTGLTEIVIPDSVETLGLVSFSSSKLKKVTIGKGVKAINGWMHCFYNNFYFEEYIVSSENQYFKADNGILTDKAGTVLYSYPTTKLVGTVTLPDGIAVIKSYAIQPSGENVTNLVIPEGVTTLEKYALNDLVNDVITLPSTLTDLHYNSIIYPNCSTLVVKATTPPSLTGTSTESQLLPLTNPRVKDYTIKIPASSVNSYKEARGWRNLADKIVAEE